MEICAAFSDTANHLAVKVSLKSPLKMTRQIYYLLRIFFFCSLWHQMNFPWCFCMVSAAPISFVRFCSVRWLDTLSDTASISGCVYISDRSWIGLYSPTPPEYFLYRDQNCMDHVQNSSRGKINVTLLWKRRQVVKCLNRGHSYSVLKTLITFFEVYHEPIKSENTELLASMWVWSAV